MLEALHELSTWKLLRPESSQKLCIRYVLLVRINGEVNLLGRSAQHAPMLRILQHSVGDAVPLLSGRFVGEPCGHIVQALPCGLEFSLSGQLRFESVASYGIPKEGKTNLICTDPSPVPHS